jgi:hypothetical protein
MTGPLRKVATLPIAAALALVWIGAVPLVARADTSPITYHGDMVITTPHVYLDFWGGEWSSGFPNGGYSAQQVENYIQTYFNNVGGSSWMNTLTQYYWVDQYGTKHYITNPGNQVKGIWFDSRSVPAGFTKSDVWFEAYGYAIPHFNDIGDYNAVYFVLTGPNRIPSDMGQSCGYHDRTAYNAHQYAYAYVPYQPTAPRCFVNQVNTNDSFGHGQLDGYSITGGHEYAEAITDPNIGNGVGWWDHYWCTHGGTWPNSCLVNVNDWSYDEIGDKCGYDEPNGPQESPTFNNVLLGNQYFAVEGLWSDAAGSCALGPIYTPPPPPPPPVGSTLSPGQTLSGGHYLRSANGRYTFVMQSDGNLVLYSPTTYLWASWTQSHSGDYVLMQGDGNLVIYRQGGAPADWASGSQGNPGAYVQVQDDGNVVIYRQGGYPAVWATNTCCNRP